MALELLDLGKAGIGFLNSGVGVGGLLGGFVALGLVGRLRLASDFGLGLALVGLPIALIAAFPHTAPALVLLALVGIGTTVVDVAGLTLLQRAVPDDVLTRVMGVAQSVFVGTLGLGAIIAPVLISAFGDRGALLAVGAPLPVCTALAWRQLRALDASIAAPTEGLELLCGIPIFRPLPPATLELVSLELQPMRVAAGTDVIREGEAGDRFYVIAAGEVDVRANGRPPGRLHAGDSFGEIALLHDVPRTATVTAATDVDLLTLDRDEFIGAVTGHPASAEAAQAVVTSRLGSLPSSGAI
jgi:MFS family permease